jgi:hypothetical protein
MTPAEPARPVLWAALSLAVAALSLALAGTLPPTPSSAAAPPHEFSAERALATLGRTLGDSAPHPTGSRAIVAVRQRIESELRSIGLEPTTATRTICGRYGACARITNVVARRAGRRSDGAVVLAAHYDSVGAGAGAADDGIGVAVLLESARAMSKDPPSERPITFLFTDGEEVGLLGAEAFVRDAKELATSAVVLNAEARGTSGPSLMFETSRGNAVLVGAFASATRRPAASSLFYSIYRRLPNDTDLSVFKRAGLAGLNFAPIGGVARYHTPLDDLEHLSPATLQQQGDNVLGTARELAARTAGFSAPGDLAFADVAGRFVVRWPLGASLWLTAGFGLLLAFALGLAARARQLDPKAAIVATAAWPVPLVVAALGSFGVTSALRAVGGLPTGWPADAWLILVALGALSLTLLTVSLLARPRTSATAEWAAAALWWSALSALVAIALPEASPLTVLPLAAFALFGALAAAKPHPLTFALRWLAPPAVTLLVWPPVLRLAYDAVGLDAGAVLASGLVLTAAPAMPIATLVSRATRRNLAISLGALCVVTCVLIPFAAPYSADVPQRLSLAYHQDTSSGAARWLVDASSGEVPPGLIRVAGFSSTVVDPFPWQGGWTPRALTAPADGIALEGPRFDVERESSRGSIRTLRAKVRSSRGARLLTLHLPSDGAIAAVRVEGEPATPRPGTRWSSVSFWGDTDAGIVVELDVRRATRIVVSDHTPGLPASGDRLQAARPPWAVPSQLGDATVASRDVEL